MNDYLLGTTLHLRERARHLVSLIPRGLGRDVDGLVALCRNALGDIIGRLDWLASSDEMQLPQNQGVRLRWIRRVVTEIDRVETSVITVLDRWNERDQALNRLTDHLAREIGYPLSAPVVSCTSRSYFYIEPRWNLLCVQPAEGRFLLHLPDLYHELGHPLLATENDPTIEPFQVAYVRAVNDAHGYLAGELQRDNTGRTPQGFRRYFATWICSWSDWANELFCDLFAALTLGPAYAWAHLHLHAGRGLEAFDVPLLAGSTVHPADAARMDVMLLALRKIGHHEDAERIRTQWEALLGTCNAGPTPEYRRCFPDSLLERVAGFAHDGLTRIGCRLASPSMSEPIRTLLNEAWSQFWLSPTGYLDWERAAVDRLQRAVS